MWIWRNWCPCWSWWRKMANLSSRVCLLVFMRGSSEFQKTRDWFLPPNIDIPKLLVFRVLWLKLDLCCTKQTCSDSSFTSLYMSLCVCLYFVRYIEILQLLTPNPRVPLTVNSFSGKGRTRPCEHFFSFWQNGERPSLLQISTAAVCSCSIRQWNVWLSWFCTFFLRQ